MREHSIFQSIFLFLLLPFFSYGQWVSQPTGTLNHILGVHFTSQNSGVAVGTGGMILKTVTGGATWTSQTVGGNSFYDVNFSDATNGVAVGDAGKVARTIDGGLSWAPVPTPVFADWRSVRFLSPQVGFITGGLSGAVGNILKTIDGGASWQDISPTSGPGASEVIYSVFFTDINTGYACNYNGFILKTVDGGASWTSQNVSTNRLFGLYFTDANTGYCVGGHQDQQTTVILKTIDAGVTWTALDNLFPFANYLIDVEFTDANTGYALGGNVQGNTGIIIKTTDAGATWTQESTSSATTSRLYRLSMINAAYGYACGLDGTLLKLGADEPGCNRTFVQSLTNMGGDRPNIFPHPNGDFFATGLHQDSTVIVRCDQGGTALWARSIYLGWTNYQISDMFVDPLSGDLFGVAYPPAFSQSELRSAVFRYNLTSHTLVWVQNIPNAAITQLHSLDASTCVLTGISTGGNTHLMRIDKNTGLVNGYSLDGTSGDYYSTLHEGVLYGTCRRYTNGFLASVFAHDPNSGAFSWQNNIISSAGFFGLDTRMYPVKPVVDQDEILVLASGDLDGFGLHTDGPVNLVLAKTDLTGNVQWTKEYLPDGFNQYVATAVVPTSNGYYIVANLYQPSMGDFAYGLLIKTDKQGQVQWAKRLGVAGRNIARNVMERNGFLYLTMASDSYNFNDLLLVKLDENGETDMDCGFVQPIQVTVNELPNYQHQEDYEVINNIVSLNPVSTLAIETTLQPVIHCSTPCVCPDPPTIAETISFCTGASVTINGQIYTESGIVVDTIPGPNECDTVATYTLIQLPLITRSESIEFCEGQSVTIVDQNYTQSGTVVVTIPGIIGCDTVVTYTLTKLPLVTRSESIEFCEGQSVTIGGQNYDQSGTVVVTIPGTVGCDTVVTYTLTKLPLVTRSESIEFCEGQSVTIGGQNYDQAGTVVLTIPGTVGCDTVVTYTLTKLPLVTRSESIEFCEGQSVTIGGQNYNQAGTVVLTIPGTVGCDTVVTYTLTKLPLVTRSETIEFCPGESIVLGGNTYTQAGQVQLILPATTGCDTLVTYHLISLTPAQSTVAIQCPQPISMTVAPGEAAALVTYPLPTVASDCPCPGIALTLSAGQASGTAFPVGLSQVCYLANDSCGNTASCCFEVLIQEEAACDIKTIGCMKYELLSIRADAGMNKTYKIRVTNQCANKLIYTAIQLPDGVVAVEPANLSIFTAASGRKYEVRNPNYSPFYSIRFKSTNDSIFNGQSDIFEYTLPAQSAPAYLHITSRLASQVFYEAHLNTFNCPVQPENNKPVDRGAALENTGLKLYPNPSAGILNITFSAMTSSDARVRIYNFLGQEVFSTGLSAGVATYALPLPERLVDGVYRLVVETGEGTRRVESFVLARGR